MTITAVKREPEASLEAIRAGSSDALAALYCRHAAALHRLAYRLTRTSQDAEDVVHDVFVGLPEALAHYEERGALLSWLKRITARVALKRLRPQKRRREPRRRPDVRHPTEAGGSFPSLDQLSNPSTPSGYTLREDHHALIAFDGGLAATVASRYD